LLQPVLPAPKRGRCETGAASPPGARLTSRPALCRGTGRAAAFLGTTALRCLGAKAPRHKRKRPSLRFRHAKRDRRRAGDAAAVTGRSGPLGASIRAPRRRAGPHAALAAAGRARRLSDQLQRLKGQGLVSMAVRGEFGPAAAAAGGTRPTPALSRAACPGHLRQAGPGLGRLAVRRSGRAARDRPPDHADPKAPKAHHSRCSARQRLQALV
jgi:hypothetical protein